MHMSIIYDSTEEKTDLQKRIRAELEEKRQRAAQKPINQKMDGFDSRGDSVNTKRSLSVVVVLIAVAAIVILMALLVRQ